MRRRASVGLAMAGGPGPGGSPASRLLLLASARFGLRHPWQLGLSLLGIALGVAVVVAIDLAVESSRRAYAIADAAITGQATHRIVGGPSGVSDAEYVELTRAIRGADLAPVVEGVVRVGGERVRLLGLDPFAEAPFGRTLGGGGAGALAGAVRAGDERTDRQLGALLALLREPWTVAVEAATAKRLGISDDTPMAVTVGGESGALRPVLIYRARSSLAEESLSNVFLADIATAQEVLGMVGRLSHVDVRVRPPTHRTSTAASSAGRAGDAADETARLEAALPANLRLERADQRARTSEQMTRAFNLNLRMLSLLALVVGIFLIYNTLSFAIVQRRELFGILRALGVTRRQVLALVAMEAAVLGLAGAVAGVALGVVLADQLLGLVSRTLNDLYMQVHVTNVHVSAAGLAKAVGMALGAALLAGAAPAVEAAGVSARTAMMRSRLESRMRALARPAALAGFALLASSALALALPGGRLSLAFASLLGVVAGFALMTPQLTSALLAALTPLAAILGGRLGAMSLRLAATSLSRTAVAVTALTVALAATVGVGVMVDSFRRTVADWLETTLRADIYVGGPGVATARGFTPALARKIAALADVEAVSTGLSVQVSGADGPVELVALQMAPSSYDGFHLLEGEAATAWPAFDARGAVLVSEPYAYRLGLEPGGAVALATDDGERRFEIAGVYRDYETDRGTVVMSRATFERHYRERRISGVGVYLSSGANEAALSSALREVTAGLEGVRIVASRRIKQASLDIFDRTFTITEVLRWLAAIIAFCGIVGALMGLALE
ncbi:MAG: FtsX-like permease family protein, partial [Gammaproteobacteria bacterium]